MSETAGYDLTARWYLEVTVEDAAGQPATGATVRATSLSAAEIVEGTTADDGRVRLVLTAYTESGDMRGNGTHDRSYVTPHAIYVEYDGYVDTVDSLEITEPTALTFVLGGSCPTPDEERNCGTDTGACEFGTQTCQPDGTWSTCVGGQGPVDEVCNGDDDDCDGDDDDNLGSTTCGLGICEHTIQNCVGGTPQICDPLEGQGHEDEVTLCDNGIDEDCDGHDAVCGVRIVQTPTDGASGPASASFSCDVTDPKGVVSIALLTDEGGSLQEVDRRDLVGSFYRFIEAEHFTFNPSHWDVCPNSATAVEGNSCEDDRVGNSNTASNLAHVVADDGNDPGDLSAMSHSVYLTGGTYAVWARSLHRDNPAARSWRLESTASGFQSSSFGDLGSGGWRWQRSTSDLVVGSDGAVTLEIVDVSPDGYWAYPDLVLVTDDLSYDPASDCGSDVAALGGRYTLGSCGTASVDETATFARTVSGTVLWACQVTNGAGEVNTSATFSYNAQ